MKEKCECALNRVAGVEVVNRTGNASGYGFKYGSSFIFVSLQVK